jgi:gamma-D-glutamyl-L-lysine dipeptidyl-peptidase
VKGITAGVADLRGKAKFRSERISQLIFGEEVKFLGTEAGYVRVIGADKLPGYVLGSLVGDLDGPRAYKLASHFAGHGVQLPFGSYLSEEDAKRWEVPKRLLAPIDSPADPAAMSKQFLGVPYLWGGTSDFGYDCSGFTQRLYRYAGIEIPRNSNWQRDAGVKVEGFDVAKRGDLVFFRGHVALHLGSRVLIHANLTHGGVSTTDLKDGSPYSKLLMGSFQGIRRFESDAV